MIRRDPTLLALSDIDVQDVREVLRRRAYEHQLASSTPAAGGSASNAAAPGGSASTDMAIKEYSVRDFSARRAALGKMTREERLGLRS